MPSRPVVLLVEDDWTLRELYRLALSLSDFTVHACEDGMQALHYLDQENPDLVILDLNLPRVPGQMVYDELRTRTQTGSRPIGRQPAGPARHRPVARLVRRRPDRPARVHGRRLDRCMGHVAD